jgi:hypothetical protein
LKLKAKKCVLFQQQVEFLGRLVSSNEIAMTDTDIKVLVDSPVPRSSKDVERFTGLANYHRVFIKNYSDIAAPLYRVTGKNNFRWEGEQQEAFDALKAALTSPPVRGLPNQIDDFILDTDASDVAIGAELIQLQHGEERVIAYGSYALTKEQRRYCTTRKELLAVVRFTRQFRHYLLGRPFVIRTDHSSLTWLLRFKEPQGQLARWMEELSQFNMVLQHRAGRKHANADALSRIPEGEWFDAGSCEIRSGDLPCGGCKHCQRADQWSAFTEDVDDAVPLALPTVHEVVCHIGVCTDMSTVRGNGETGGVGDDEDVLTDGVDNAVPMALPTVREDVRHIGVCTDMSTVKGNGETGGVGYAVPLAPPTVREVVRDIGVCTDVSTGGGNGETEDVSDEAAAAKGDNSGKPDPDQQGLSSFESTEESSSYGNSFGIVLTGLPKRPAGIVPQEVSSLGHAALEESSSYGNPVGIVLTGLPK